MSFRLVPKLVTLNDRERRNGCCIALFTEFSKPAFQKTICGTICIDDLLYFLVRVQCRRK